MIYDVDFTWMIAVAILIGLGLTLTFLSEEKMSMQVMLIYMTIINAFLVATDFLPLWTEIMFLLIIVALAIMELKASKRGMV